MHQACALARNSSATVTLLRFMRVTHLSDLGTDFGYASPTRHEYHLMDECAATAEDYGVQLKVESLQYTSMVEAAVQAVSLFDADVIFAHVNRSWIPYWRRFQTAKLRYQLESNLILLDSSDAAYQIAPRTVEQGMPLKNQLSDDSQLPVR